MKCPFCAEDIKDEATKCRFCQEEINAASKQGFPRFYKNVSRNGLCLQSLIDDYYTFFGFDTSDSGYCYAGEYMKYARQIGWSDDDDKALSRRTTMEVTEAMWDRIGEIGENSCPEAKALSICTFFMHRHTGLLNGPDKRENLTIVRDHLTSLKQECNDLPTSDRFRFLKEIDSEINYLDSELLEMLEKESGKNFPNSPSSIQDIQDITQRPSYEHDTGAKSKVSRLIYFIFIASLIILTIYYFVSSGRNHSLQSLPQGVTAFSDPVTENLPSGPGSLNIHLRSGPGKEFPAVGVQMAGTSITEVGRAVDAEGKPWLAIRREDGSVAFIKERFIHP